MAHRKNGGVRQVTDGVPSSEQDTNKLIDSFTSSNDNPLWNQSTTDIINTDIRSLAEKVPRDVSESTMLIDHDRFPKTPLRRTVSGSSLEIQSPSTFFQSSPYPPASSQSLPEVQPEIDTALLNRLLSSLPSSDRVLHFKGIFKNYITMLEDHDVNISSDKFIITLYNQLRKRSNRTKLDALINIFIDKPANEAMRISNFWYFKDLKLKAKIFKLWAIKKKSADLAKSEKVYQLYIQKKYLSTWILKYNLVTEELEANALLFNRVKCMMKVWDMWRSRSMQQLYLEEAADVHQKKRFLNLWKGVIINDHGKADEFYQENLKKKALKRWRLKQVEKSGRLSLRGYLRFWKKTYDDHKVLEEEGKDLEVAFHAGFFFTIWKRKARISAAKTTELANICEKFTVSKYFDRWLEALKYKSVENEVLAKRNEFLLSFALNLWRNRLEHQIILQTHLAKIDLASKREIFKNWRNRMSSSKIAHSIDRKRLLSGCFKQWKLETIARAVEANRNYKIAETVWGQWRQKSQLEIRLQKYEMTLVHKAWNVWRSKTSKLESSVELSIKASESFTKLTFLKNWQSSINAIEELGRRADQFIIRRYLKKWKALREKLEQNENKAILFHKSDSGNIVRKRYFKVWLEKNEKRIEDRLISKIASYEISVRKIRLAAVFKSWNSQFHAYLTQERLYKENILKGLYAQPILNQWLHKVRMYKELEQKADEINALNLLAAGFTKMQLQMFRIQELNVRLLEYQEDSNLKLIVKTLSDWGLKTMKVKRDNGTIQNFRRRWNRAHARAILLLWKAKTLDSQYKRNKGNPSVSDDDDEFTEGIEDDDDSPTKFKSKFRSILAAQTPQKAIIDPLNGYTGQPSSTRSGIPGSEKIIRKRMEALRSHYSQIKYAIPSPLKTEPSSKPMISGPESSKLSSKKLDFTKSRLTSSNVITDDHIDSDLRVISPLPLTESLRNLRINEVDTDPNDSFDEFEGPISSPIISHKNILTRYSYRSKDDLTNGLFKHDLD